MQWEVIGLMIFPWGWRAGQAWTERLGGREESWGAHRVLAESLPAPLQLWHQEGISHDSDRGLKWPKNNPTTLMSHHSPEQTVNTGTALTGISSGSECWKIFTRWCHHCRPGFHFMVDVWSLRSQSNQQLLCNLTVCKWIPRYKNMCAYSCTRFASTVRTCRNFLSCLLNLVLRLNLDSNWGSGFGESGTGLWKT